MTVLLLTVGTGTRGRTEETILEPFGMSLRAAGCQRNILLPSRQTLPQAEMVREANPEFAIEIRPLPRDGDENDADACFVHFDAVFESLLASGVPPEEIIADITRGTKAMSAALLMAAAIHRAGKVRYLVGGRQNESGSAVPGTESPRDIEPAFIRLRYSLQLAEQHLRAFSYRAVETLLDPWLPLGARPQTPVQRQIAAWLWAARFWGAWDRFDYKEAKRLASRSNLPAVAPASIELYLPSEQQIAHLETLAGEAPPEAKDNPAYCRALAADLIANAERRFREGQNEEVLVRLYRVFELIGQYRLFEHGIDTGKPDVSDPRLRAWLESQGKPLPGREAEELRLPRLEAAKLLEFLEKSEPGRGGPDVGQRLVGLSWLGEWGPEMRNTSLLIHGFKARTRGRENELKKLLKQTRDFYQSEDGGNAQRLEACRFPFLEGAPAGNVPAEGRDNVVNVEPSRRASAE